MQDREMTDDLRNLMKQFLDENPDTVQPVTAAADALVIVEAMKDRIRTLAKNIPPHMMTNPQFLLVFSTHVKVLCEFEVMAEHGILYRDDAEVLRRASEFLEHVFD